MTAQTPWDSLKELIKKIQAENAKFSAFDQFSKFFKNRLDWVRGKNKLDETPLVRIEIAIEKFFFINLVIKRKIDALLPILGMSIEYRNLIAISQFARALLEHIAALAYLSTQLEKLHSQIQNQSDSKSIEAATQKAEQFLVRAYHGKSPKLEQNKENQAIHINDAIKSLEVWVADASNYYDFLTEYVHPNSGSNSLISISDAEDTLLSIEGDLQRPDAKTIAMISQELLASVSAIELHTYSHASFIGLLINRAINHELRTENMFVVRQLDVVGDGLSKETPMKVPKARDAFESMQTIMSFFQKKNYEIYSQTIGDMKQINGYMEILDIYETSKGRLWVLIRHKI
jgi:hypothetical protein